ncbi:single-stranded DNA-binding protein [Marinospirillum insulare]|uniref:Single-stranded DNA-binding protein n=1 Tax=Marinospirillum insulare TaxID=217169 RepID=A0ABQ6A020_9GAMM|nr:single-stranded DNA-binding protein [Marinospirillum insulare]GLR63479.1 hypothetical protein GCM10007878_09140 [Marinospirillum insulare]
MARGVNKVILIGNLGNDPDIRFTQNQKQVANLSIATSEQWTDRQTGQRQERTEWHKVVFFDRLAEIAGQYLKKGSKVYVEGKLQTRKWQNQQGIDQYTTEIVGNEMQMLDGRGDGGGQNYGNAGQQMQGGYQQQQPQNQAAPQQQAYANPVAQQPQQPAPQPQQPAPQQSYASQAPQAMAQQQQPFANNPAPVASQPAMQPTHQQPAQPAAPTQAPQQPAQQPQQSSPQAFNDFDDEIPF